MLNILLDAFEVIRVLKINYIGIIDVVFNEGKQRLKQGNAPESMAIMRKLALQTLLKNKGRKSMKTIRKKIAWNEDLLIDVLLNF